MSTPRLTKPTYDTDINKWIFTVGDSTRTFFLEEDCRREFDIVERHVAEIEYIESMYGQTRGD